MILWISPPMQRCKKSSGLAKRSQASLENFRTASNAGMPYFIPFDSAVFFLNTIDRDRIKGLTPVGVTDSSVFSIRDALTRGIRPTFGTRRQPECHGWMKIWVLSIREIILKILLDQWSTRLDTGQTNCWVRTIRSV